MACKLDEPLLLYLLVSPGSPFEAGKPIIWPNLWVLTNWEGPYPDVSHVVRLVDSWFEATWWFTCISIRQVFSVAQTLLAWDLSHLGILWKTLKSLALVFPQTEHRCPVILNSISWTVGPFILKQRLTCTSTLLVLLAFHWSRVCSIVCVEWEFVTL